MTDTLNRLLALAGRPALLESVSMLQARPETILHAIIDAKIMNGDDLDGGDEDEANENLCSDILMAQESLRRHVKNGRVEVHRAIAVTPEWLKALRPGAALGVFWSYDLDGAYAYNGDRKQVVVVFSGLVAADAVDWATTIGIESAGEREIRTFGGSDVLITNIGIMQSEDSTELEPVCQNLWGKAFNC